MKYVLQYLRIPNNRLDCLLFDSIKEGAFHRGKSKTSTNEVKSPFCHLSVDVQKEGRTIIERYVNLQLLTSSDNFDVSLGKFVKNEMMKDTKNDICSKSLFAPI